VLFDARGGLLFNFFFTFAVSTTVCLNVVLLCLRLRRGLQVMRLQMRLRIPRWRPSPQRSSRLLRVILINQTTLLIIVVSASLRQRLIIHLRLLVKEPLLVRILLHLLEISNAILNLTFNMVILPSFRGSLIRLLLMGVIVIESH
jgi:hypothetical protein